MVSFSAGAHLNVASVLQCALLEHHCGLQLAYGLQQLLLRVRRGEGCAFVLCEQAGMVPRNASRRGVASAADIRCLLFIEHHGVPSKLRMLSDILVGC